MNAHGLPTDVDDAIYQALLDAGGGELAFSATDAVCRVLASRRDALSDMLQPLPDAKPLNWLLGYDIGAS